MIKAIAMKLDQPDFTHSQFYTRILIGENGLWHRVSSKYSIHLSKHPFKCFIILSFVYTKCCASAFVFSVDYDESGEIIIVQVSTLTDVDNENFATKFAQKLLVRTHSPQPLECPQLNVTDEFPIIVFKFLFIESFQKNTRVPAVFLKILDLVRPRLIHYIRHHLEIDPSLGVNIDELQTNQKHHPDEDITWIISRRCKLPLSTAYFFIKVISRDVNLSYSLHHQSLYNMLQ